MFRALKKTTHTPIPKQLYRDLAESFIKNVISHRQKSFCNAGNPLTPRLTSLSNSVIGGPTFPFYFTSKFGRRQHVYLQLSFVFFCRQCVHELLLGCCFLMKGRDSPEPLVDIVLYHLHGCYCALSPGSYCALSPGCYCFFFLGDS